MFTSSFSTGCHSCLVGFLKNLFRRLFIGAQVYNQVLNVYLWKEVLYSFIISSLPSHKNLTLLIFSHICDIWCVCRREREREAA